MTTGRRARAPPFAAAPRPLRPYLSGRGAFKRHAIGGINGIQDDIGEWRDTEGSFGQPTAGFRTGFWQRRQPLPRAARAIRRIAGCIAPRDRHNDPRLGLNACKAWTRLVKEHDLDDAHVVVGSHYAGEHTNDGKCPKPLFHRRDEYEELGEEPRQRRNPRQLEQQDCQHGGHGKVGLRQPRQFVDILHHAFRAAHRQHTSAAAAMSAKQPAATAACIAAGPRAGLLSVSPSRGAGDRARRRRSASAAGCRQPAGAMKRGPARRRRRRCRR